MTESQWICDQDSSISLTFRSSGWSDTGLPWFKGRNSIECPKILAQNQRYNICVRYIYMYSASHRASLSLKQASASIIPFSSLSYPNKSHATSIQRQPEQFRAPICHLLVPSLVMDKSAATMYWMWLAQHIGLQEEARSQFLLLVQKKLLNGRFSGEWLLLIFFS